MIWLRAGVYFNKSVGTTRRVLRSRAWDQLDLADLLRDGVPSTAASYAEFKRRKAPDFLFPLGQPPQIPGRLRQGELTRRPALADRVKLLRENRCVYFFDRPSPAAIDWYRNPFNGCSSDPSAHFSQLPDFVPQQGDLRTLWEPARAAWAIDCAKAAAAGETADIGDIYWRWMDSWMDSCPPYQGVHWKCGQESSVRLIAMLIGFWAVANNTATDEKRFRQIARLAWATGFRIYHHINYAISQKNNHAISEAVGLMLIGQLFPEFRTAAAWKRRGRQVLEQEVRRQVYLDGSYVQHSMNYQRVMMHGAILGVRLAELAGDPLSRKFYDRLGCCADFMFEILDTDTGRMPHYGNNDSAHVLPLSECDLLDFRPVVQAAHFAVHRQRPLPSGPWDEDLFWLYGAEALAADTEPPCQRTGRAFDDGGYYTLRQPHSWCMLRCHTYRDRPGQCDPLHLDLWWKGVNLLRDCGTFQYYVPDRPDLEYYFKSVRAHNTVQIDNQSPLEPTSRFLWFPWPSGTVRHYASKRNPQRAGSRDVIYLEAEHYDYDRAPWNLLHRRSVIGIGGDWWIIVDDLLGRQPHEAVLRWHLPDVPFTLDMPHRRVALQTHAGDVGICVSGYPRAERDIAVIRGGEQQSPVRGLAASYYGRFAPIPTLELTVEIEGTQRWITAIGPQIANVMRNEEPTAAMNQESVSIAADFESWTIESQERSCCLRLAPPHRSTPQIYLSHKEMQGTAGTCTVADH